MGNDSKLWSVSSASFLALSMLALWVWPKFFGVGIHPIFGWAEAQSGVTWLEPGARYGFAVLALILAVAVMIPKTRLYAAGAALAVSVLFLVAHATPWLGINIPTYGPMMEALAQGKTAAEIQAMGLKGDRGAHFTLAFINAVLAGITLASELGANKPKPKTYKPMQVGV